MTREQECAIEAGAFRRKAVVAMTPIGGLLTVERIERAIALLTAAKSRLEEAEALRAERIAREPPAANDPGKKAGL